MMAHAFDTSHLESGSRGVGSRGWEVGRKDRVRMRENRELYRIILLLTTWLLVRHRYRKQSKKERYQNKEACFFFLSGRQYHTSIL